MTLDAWMIMTKTPNASFGERLEKSGEAVRRYRSGEREPDTKLMAQIFDLTGGLVTPNDWAGVGPRSNETGEQVAS